MRIDVLGAREVPKEFEEFVNGPLLNSLTGTEENQVLSVMLGGSHSKGLSNSRSDVDLIMYYTTNARNLLSFNRQTLSVVPKHGGFQQVKSEPVLYEWRGMLYELLTVPVRRVGEGNDLFTNLYKGNMKTIHDLLKDYELLGPPSVYAGVRSRFVFAALIDALKEPDRFDIPIESVVGYFHGYMTSQLMSHRRKSDYEKRELKAWREHDVNPVVKAIMNGMYIGLSGLLLLDKRAVSREFGGLWAAYRDEFTDEQKEFIDRCYLHKIDMEPIIGSVDTFLEESAVLRDAIFDTLRARFNISKGAALAEGRFAVDPDTHKNHAALDDYQLDLLGLRE